MVLPGSTTRSRFNLKLSNSIASVEVLATRRTTGVRAGKKRVCGVKPAAVTRISYAAVARCSPWVDSAANVAETKRALATSKRVIFIETETQSQTMAIHVLVKAETGAPHVLGRQCFRAGCQDLKTIKGMH